MLNVFFLIWVMDFGLGRVGYAWAWGLANVCGLGLVVGSSGLNVGFFRAKVKCLRGVLGRE